MARGLSYDMGIPHTGLKQSHVHVKAIRTAHDSYGYSDPIHSDCSTLYLLGRIKGLASALILEAPLQPKP